jgi:hypothetical protein
MQFRVSCDPFDDLACTVLRRLYSEILMQLFDEFVVLQVVKRHPHPFGTHRRCMANEVGTPASGALGAIKAESHMLAILGIPSLSVEFIQRGGRENLDV